VVEKMKPKVYTQCTCCYRPLTPEEIKKHEAEENYYFTICNNCLKKSSDRLLKIVSGKNK
jgi:hypothetical protein